MKRSRVALLAVALVFVFIAVIVAYLPASWVVLKLPANLPLRCTDVGGSIWEGECLGLNSGDKRLGDATWNISRLGVLRSRIAGDVDLRGALTARADLDLDFSGNGELRDVKATIPLDPQVLPNVPPYQRGLVIVDLARAVITNRAARTLDGSIEIRDLKQVGARPLDLGSYRAVFDGVESGDGTAVGTLTDTGGPFELRGTVTLTPPNTYLVQGTIAGRTGQAESVVREITLGAAPDTSGRTPFSFEGSY
jgi:hypothetical protein